MGVVNTTPDSFTDGTLDPDAAIALGMQLWQDGADILDVGGEATNPKATPVDADEELRRVLPVVRALAGAGARVSIDTTKAAVARAALAAGASIVNDVSGGLWDPEMPAAVGDATYIAGHLRGGSLTEVFTAEAPASWREVADELAARIAPFPNVWVDPGLGFGKGAGDTNLELIKHAGDLGRALGKPVVVGPSRKRFLRRLLDDERTLGGSGAEGRRGGIANETPLQLDVASVAACLAAVTHGASVLRIHNVALLRAALAVYTRL